ncbi:hypothetical protein CROQUDRAFT_658416 [Cronartium quercuum f. sp. fusiforme G11]|uniref:TFIIS N-terminal domain-containing protein n=1 Tax=Cronartium quercuum f. sp. fusiforme G11 TaxID=708437 RepID=A0A9P6NF00_9BASI|nr:hypothetical protein CROQUDRAFT_658416 [Cronartium quercuum f. sp. fusiforme G11]
MSIDTQSLKLSELGKVILFYTNCKRVDTSVKCLANNLVSKWVSIGTNHGRQVLIPFEGFTIFTIQFPAGTSMHKHNQRTDDVTALTTCDCHGRQ